MKPLGIYQPEKQESAWEIFRRLNMQYEDFISVLGNRFKTYSPFTHLIFCHTESEAIQIMKEIEKEIRE